MNTTWLGTPPGQKSSRWRSTSPGVATSRELRATTMHTGGSRLMLRPLAERASTTTLPVAATMATQPTTVTAPPAAAL